jgi:glycerol-3-phosphate dehydrogenase
MRGAELVTREDDVCGRRTRNELLGIKFAHATPTEIDLVACLRRQAAPRAQRQQIAASIGYGALIAPEAAEFM